MQEERKTSRVEWIDVLKFICIFFVMCSHTNGASATIAVGYTPFFLLGFFFASGYVYKRAPFKVFLKKKLFGILLPWGIFAIILPLIKNLLTGGDVLGVFLGNILQIRAYGDSLWYLTALFVTFFPFYFIEKYLSAAKALAVSGILALASMFYLKFCPAINYKIFTFTAATNALPWHLEIVFMANLFMVLGRYYKGKPEEYTKQLVKPWLWIILFVAYLSIVISYNYMTGNFIGLGSYGGKDVISIFVWIAAESFGLVSLVIISKLIKPNKFILFAGANTLIFYALHIEVVNFFIHLPARLFYGWGAGKIYTTVNIVFDYVFDIYIDPYPELYTVCGDITYAIVYAANTLISMVVLIAPSLIINYLAPFVVGKKYPLATKVRAGRIIKKVFKKNVKTEENELLYAEKKIKDLYSEGKINEVAVIPSGKEDAAAAVRISEFSEKLGLKAQILSDLKRDPSEEIPPCGAAIDLKASDEKNINVGEFSDDENSPASKFIRLSEEMANSGADCIVTIGEKAKSAEKAVSSNRKKGDKKRKIIRVEE